MSAGHDFEKLRGKPLGKEICDNCTKSFGVFAAYLHCRHCNLRVHEACARKRLDDCVGGSAAGSVVNMYKVGILDPDLRQTSVGILHVSDSAIRLLCHKTQRVVACWPLIYIRRYGFDEAVFKFEAGRRCQGGAGVYQFATDRALEIFKIVEADTKMISRQTKGARHLSASAAMGTLLSVSSSPDLLSSSAPSKSRTTLPPSVNRSVSQPPRPLPRDADTDGTCDGGDEFALPADAVPNEYTDVQDSASSSSPKKPSKPQAGKGAIPRRLTADDRAASLPQISAGARASASDDYCEVDEVVQPPVDSDFPDPMGASYTTLMPTDWLTDDTDSDYSIVHFPKAGVEWKCENDSSNYSGINIQSSKSKSKTVKRPATSKEQFSNYAEIGPSK